MTSNQDARPFAHLKKDAVEFHEKFDDDIKECMDFLDAKLKALICDPDSLGVKNVKQNALVEFSKAKYDIFIGVKLLINRKEKEWLNYISEMKRLFIENVEVFLAGTKLEVKLPSSEFQSSLGQRKSPGQKSSSIVTNSLYPILNTVTRNIPVLKPPLLIKNPSTTSPTGIHTTVYYNTADTDSSESSANEDKPEFIQERELMELDSDENDQEILEKSVSQKLQHATVSRPGRGRKQNKLSERSTRSNELELENTGSEDEELETSNESASLNVNPQRVLGRSSRLRRAENRGTADEEEPAIVTTKARRGRPAASKNSENSSSAVVTVRTETRRGRPAASKKSENSSCDKSVVQAPRRGRKSVKIAYEPQESVPSSSLISSDEHSESGVSKTRKKGIPIEANIQDDLDVYSSLVRPIKSSGRRKTLLPNLEDISGADIIPGISNHKKSKRKTICDVSELESVTSSKRLKVSSRRGTPLVLENDVANDNLLESDDNYSEWITLKNIDGKIPTLPAIYEVKVWRAKKPAYIGFCDSLRQRVTLYNLRQNSGHKHLDKFIERNYDDIQIRYEVVSSVNDAKGEVKHRLDKFVAEYRTTPAYN